MDFQITGLPAQSFHSLFTLNDAELVARSAIRMVANCNPGFPCRVSLQDAAIGETVILINHEHLAVAGPYRSRHAIFVREHARDARLAVNEVPEVITRRLLSVRAFDAAGLMQEADVLPGTQLREVAAKMLDRKGIQFLHIHNAKPGCFAARVDPVR
jgi:Protein of unknown function (DUF1203)